MRIDSVHDWQSGGCRSLGFCIILRLVIGSRIESWASADTKHRFDSELTAGRTIAAETQRVRIVASLSQPARGGPLKKMRSDKFFWCQVEAG